MAALIFTRNPMSLEGRDVSRVPDGSRPIDWLVEHHPKGCGGPVMHWHNGERILDESPDYLDRPIAAGDVVVLAVQPAEPITTTMILTAILTAALSAAVSIGLSLIFAKPGAPNAAVPSEMGSSNPAYDVRSRQNTARLGEPVPVVYGEVLTTPDLITQGYPWFQGGRSMHLDQLMCIGHGDFDVLAVTVGETDAELIEGDAVQFIVVPPAEHDATFGRLNSIALAAGWVDGFHENPWVSLEVGQQRFTIMGDTAGWFRVGRAGVSYGQFVVISIEFPRGLYFREFDGELIGGTANWEVDVQEADADGQPIGAVQTFPNSVSATTYDPLRMTYSIDCGRNGAWLARIRRTSNQHAEPNGMDEFNWRTLMLSCTHTQAQAYGDVTLLMVRIEAEEVASSADRLVRARVVRRLQPLGSGTPAATTSAADAFIDIYTSPIYGARRPLAEIDGDKLAELRTLWAGYKFNAVYAQRSTVWNGLAQCLQGVAAAPLPIGSLMSIVQDGIRAARSMLFSEQNVVQRTFALSYQFEATGESDGIEIEYVDGQTWAPAYTRYPLTSLSPDRVNLFGCSDATHAEQFARLQWQRRQKLRRMVEFQTELEGLIPMPGERVAVAHTLPRWGVSGYVAGVAGLTVTLDRALPWASVPAPYAMMFRTQEGGASLIVAATRGASDDVAVLSADPWAGGGGWIIGQRQEGTHWAWGDAARVVKDFTLTSLAPKGGALVGVSGLIYDPSVYTDTLTFLAGPVP